MNNAAQNATIVGIFVACAGFIATLVAMQPPPPVVVEVHMVEYTITKTYPPKHFMVDLTDQYGATNRAVAVSKHCNRWQEVVIGSKIKLPVQIWRDHEGKTSTHIVASSVCPGN